MYFNKYPLSIQIDLGAATLIISNVSKRPGSLRQNEAGILRTI